jgi:hypothetical protein
MEHVTIFDCASLENLHGLEELTSANSLQILGNASLESLRALSGVTAIDLDLSIYGNPSLPTCEALWLRDSIGVTNIGSVSIGMNNDAGTCP